MNYKIILRKAFEILISNFLLSVLYLIAVLGPLLSAVCIICYAVIGEVSHTITACMTFVITTILFTMIISCETTKFYEDDYYKSKYYKELIKTVCNEKITW